MHVIAAKAVAFKEAASKEFKDYQEQVIDNARVMAKVLQERGLRIVSGRTDCHMFLVDFVPRILPASRRRNPGAGAHYRQQECHTQRSAETFCYQRNSIGSPAITTRGFTEIEAEQLANLIADVLDAPTDIAVISQVAEQAKTLCAKFPVYKVLIAQPASSYIHP